MKAIIAVNKLGYIGLNDSLPWRCSEDLKHFKRMTDGCTLLVGYNTAQKMPPLPGRNVVVDERESEIDPSSIDWCIGGKKTYEKYCHLFTELHVSDIDNGTKGDTIYPDFSNLNPDCQIFRYEFAENPPK
jgi:dihydrofolate reductase